ncbi:uncharacterized protein LOC129586592 [Paramacrobiotus metropolitanus]|uniref:uncharacterized protein LOC129586592 n=1 Tax=Paramacrobiotus metropolitanus TaxID=2943436 RepID=UPI002445BD06|nr:uncharacterized protein LOC129586592 [Paramacrobiotus metropolitanus]
MIRRILKRLLCLLSPRKCFVLLVLSSVCLLVLIMWNQSVMDGGVAPRGEALRGKILVEPSAARNVSYALLKGEDFVFDVTPEGSVCGGSGVTAALEREEGVRVRWGELLQARPDNEEPAAPAPPESYGVVVVTGACDRLTRESIRRTWGSGAWMKGARIRVVFVCRLMAGSKEDDPMATESRLFADILQYLRLPTDF